MHMCTSGHPNKHDMQLGLVAVPKPASSNIWYRTSIYVHPNLLISQIDDILNYKTTSKKSKEIYVQKHAAL